MYKYWCASSKLALQLKASLPSGRADEEHRPERHRLAASTPVDGQHDHHHRHVDAHEHVLGDGDILTAVRYPVEHLQQESGTYCSDLQRHTRKLDAWIYKRGLGI